jgi:hypothetical protein
MDDLKSHFDAIEAGSDRLEGGLKRVTAKLDVILRRMRTYNRIGWLVTALAITGVVLNNFQLWPCFLVWMASNTLSAAIHFGMGPRSLFVRDILFLILAAVGLWQWTR